MRRIADAERLKGVPHARVLVGIEPAPAEFFDGVRAERVLAQLRLEPVRGELIDAEQFVDGAPGRLGFATLRIGGGLLDLDASEARESLGGFGKRQPLELHQEVEDAALLFAAEAVEKAAFGIDMKARGRLLVKRTQAYEAPPLSREFDRFREHRDDVRPLPDGSEGLW